MKKSLDEILLYIYVLVLDIHQPYYYLPHLSLHLHDAFTTTIEDRGPISRIIVANGVGLRDIAHHDGNDAEKEEREMQDGETERAVCSGN